MRKITALFGSSRRVLPDAVADFRPSSADIHGAVIAGPRDFGWLLGALPAPFGKADRYLVEFLGKDEVRVVAYLDQFGRAFTTNEPIEAPPARKADLSMVLIADGTEVQGAERHGSFIVANERGEE
ncbi:MAG: hypothetical protein LUB61_01245, partial [Eggerthellaceae bacterium]|nr:hypothetical protein [Eggerthellaceae bacterium]